MMTDDTIQSLIWAIDKATTTLEVLVESTDYYRRAGDTEKAYVQIIDPQALKDALMELTTEQ